MCSLRPTLNYLLLVVAMVIIAGDRLSLEAGNPRPRPCDPRMIDATYPPELPDPKWHAPGPLPRPKWRPGSYPACLGGTADAPGSGFCQHVWCGDGVLGIDPDPIQAHEGESIEIQLSIIGRLETGGNLTTSNGAEISWGDGTDDSMPIDQALGHRHTHSYVKSGEYYLSARLLQDFKYDGKGSCSYRCDLRRVVIVDVYPALKTPHLHTVLKGESLSVIATMYGADDWIGTYLANRNTVRWADLIYPGQVLLVVQNISNMSDTFADKVSRAWGRLRGWDPFRGWDPLTDKPPEKANPHDAVQSIGEWSIDKQVEIQTEGGRKELESQIEDKLRNGSKGVVVRVSVYTRGEAKIPQVEWWGEGETPLIGIGDGLGANVGRNFPGFYFDARESYFSFYTLKDGKLTHNDLLPGVLTSGDAEQIREQAEKAKEAIRIGKAISDAMNAANAKATTEKDLDKNAKDASSSASARKILDEGPGATRQQAKNTATTHSTDHPDTKNAGSLPSSSTNNNGNNSSANAGNNSSNGRDVGGLPPPGNGVPIGGEHPGAPPKGKDNDNGDGIPIGNPPQPSKNPLPEGNPWKDGKPENGPKDQSLINRPLNSYVAVPSFAMIARSEEQAVVAQQQTGRSGYDATNNDKQVVEKDKRFQHDPQFWGMSKSRNWVDVNKDGIKDFCRISKVGRTDFALRCTLAASRSITDRYSGETFETKIDGVKAGSIPGTWVDVNGDGYPDFCRVIPTSKTRGWLSCVPVVGGNAFGTEIRSAEPVDLGIASGRAWIDFDGDGKTDFCTMLQSKPGVGRLSCILSNGNGFIGKPVLSQQIRWRGPAFRRWIVTTDGTAEFCTVAGPGSAFVDCTVSSKDSFGETFRDLLDHGSNSQ